MQTVQDIAGRIKSDWTPPNPAALHWDGKLIETLENKYKKDDRLPTLISGIGGVKLLGVPACPVKSGVPAGNLIADATLGLWKHWNCEDNVAAMVFDTTACNTGIFLLSFKLNFYTMCIVCHDAFKIYFYTSLSLLLTVLF